MKLCIIAGDLKRRTIKLSGTAAVFRPTKEIVRGAVADYLGKRIADARVADMCAGSGAFGFELLSRGAREVHFIEKNFVRCQKIREQARVFSVGDQCRVFRRDVRRYLQQCTSDYDIIYFDPPYDDDTLPEIVPNLLTCVAADGILVFERRSRRIPSPQIDQCIIESRTYGDTQIDFYAQRKT